MTTSPAANRPSILVQLDRRDVWLYQQLAALGCRLLGFPAALVNAVRAEGIAVEPVDLAGGMPAATAARTAEATQRMFRTFRQAIGQPGVWQQLAGSDSRLVERLQEALLRAFYHQSGPAASVVEVFDALRRASDLRLVLVRDEQAQPMKTLLVAARERGVPSVSLMHYTPYLPPSDGHLIADLTAVFGPSGREFFAGLGLPADRVVITGNPAWDRYRHLAAVTDTAEVRRSLGLTPDRPAVMVASTLRSGHWAADFYYPDWPWQHFRAAVDALARLHQRRPLQLVIKVHPAELVRENVERYIQHAERSGIPHVTLTQHANPQHLLACDLVVCPESNIAIEAILLGRPVVNVRLGNLFPGYLLDAERDAALVATDPAAVEDAIQRALFDERTRDELASRRPHSAYHYNYLDDGRAGERVIQLVTALLEPEAAARHLAQGAPAALGAAPSGEQRESIGRQHVEQAQRLLGEGSVRAAALVAAHGAAFLAHPAPAHFLRGAALLSTDAAAARDAFAEAVAADPAPAHLNGLAGALVELGRLEEAHTTLLQALAAAPEDVDTLANLGEVLLQLGRRDEAARFLTRAAAAAPGDQQIADLLTRARLSS